MNEICYQLYQRKFIIALIKIINAVSLQQKMLKNVEKIFHQQF